MVKAKEIEGLNCEGSAVVEIRLVLGVRLSEMCGLRGSALEWADAEGVHDMRVASRRLRSALRDFNPYLRKRRLAAAAAELKRVADALGGVRDEDVAIMALEELQRDAPEDVAGGISELVLERRARQGSARATLVHAITEEKLAELQADFTRSLERAVKPRKKQGSDNALSFRAAGREIILARLEELRELSGCLYRPFDMDALHEMRIAAKRLRYAMELFAACYGEELTGQAHEVAELQTSLGELHDCDVWLEGFGLMLREFKKRESGNVSSAAAAAIARKRNAAVWLLRHFAKARMKHFGGTLVRWHDWEAQGFFQQLTKSLDAGRADIESLPATPAASDVAAPDTEQSAPA
jgi:CHAD domain-containing protein